MTDWAYRLFGCGTNDPNEYCEYVRKAKEKLATEVVPRNFRVKISEGQQRPSGRNAYSFQYAHKQLFYEGYGHTIPTFTHYVNGFGGEAYYICALPGDSSRPTCPKEPTLTMFYDLCLELDVLRSQIEELVKDIHSEVDGAEQAELNIQSELDELRAELAELKKAKIYSDIYSEDVQSEVDELRAELAELKKVKDVQSEVDELRAELAELKKSKDVQSEVDELRAELAELKKAKDVQSEVDELRAELAELKSKQRPKGRFGLFHKQS